VLLIAKNAYDAGNASDGLRCLTTRYWPRGLKRGDVDIYLPDLAPSAPLLKARLGGQVTWRQFAQRYRAEMRRQGSLLRLLAHLDAQGQRLTLLCTCRDAGQCHRTLLAGLIAKAGWSELHAVGQHD
jgi:uncharacterized protein YeaO (DUF488 family)